MGSTRKKITILLSSIVALFLVATGIVVAVLAARTGIVNSTISISYTAYQVKAEVTGTYQIKNGTVTDLTTGSDTPASTKITFTGDESTGVDNTKSFNAVSINLTEDNNTVTFIYTIKNTNTTDAMSIKMTAPTLTDTNLKVSSATATNGGTAVSSFTDTISSVAAGATAVITVVIEIDDLDKNVNLSSASFSFTLSKVTA